jgi:OmpA-OmpF porin, OOP family
MMMKATVLLCAASVPALASASDVGHWYLTPQFGGISVDNDRPVEDKDWLYGLALGKHVSEALSVELGFDGAQVGGGPGRSDLNLYSGAVNLLGVMNRDGRFSPYVSVGLGANENDPSPGENETDFMSQAGIGAFVKLWESGDGSRSLALRPDVKVRWDDAGAEGTLRDYVGTLGFQYSFGAARAEPRSAVPPPPPPVTASPPPPPPPPPPVPAAPADTDQDGVTDDIDKCPGTPRGVAVDATGCPRQGSITLEGVTFEVNSARLTPASRAILEDVARDLVKYPRLRIELQGHTDSSGSDAYNLKLSQDRADAVRALLVEQGVPADQVVARGYGETKPIAENTTTDGRARNRRVVMFVLSNPGDVKVEGEGAVQR